MAGDHSRRRLGSRWNHSRREPTQLCTQTTRAAWARPSSEPNMIPAPRPKPSRSSRATGIACDLEVGDEVRLSAAEQLAALGPSA